MKTIRLHRKRDAKVVQDFLEKESEYFAFQDGKVPGPRAGDELFADTPGGVSPEDKMVLGFFEESRLVGVADCLMGYPVANTLMIGLLIISSKMRRRGLGSKALGEIRKMSGSSEKFRIGVLADNEIALAFWQGRGFITTGEKGVWDRETGTIPVIVMEKSVYKM